MTPPEVRSLLWNGLFKAHVNVRYFTRLHRWYTGGARWTALLAAVTGCASVAGLKGWDQHTGAWTALTVATAVLGVISAVFNFPKESGTLGELRTQWVASQQRWDRAWAEAISVTATVATVEALQRAEADLEAKASSFSTITCVLNGAQDEACDVLRIARKATR